MRTCNSIGMDTDLVTQLEEDLVTGPSVTPPPVNVINMENKSPLCDLEDIIKEEIDKSYTELVAKKPNPISFWNMKAGLLMLRRHLV